MATTSRIAMLILVVAVAAVLPGTAVVALPAAHHPAGCHGDVPNAPPSAPISHQCCVTGHQSAMPSAAFSPRPHVAQVWAASSGDDLSFASQPVDKPPRSQSPTGSPPGLAPLRI